MMQSAWWTVACVVAALVVGAGCDGVDECNGECLPGTVCDPTLLACVPDTGGLDAGVLTCAIEADCRTSARPHCDSLVGECVECLRAADCASGVCLADHTCGDGSCQDDGDCAGKAGTPFCESDGRCVECRVPAHCPSQGGQLRTCDRQTFRCKASGCTADLDCAAVASRPACDSGTGQCVECLSDLHCGDGLPPRCDSTSRRCVPCLENADCDVSAGQTCTADHTCRVTGCTSNAACIGPQICDPATRVCVSCVEQADCAFGGICTGHVCVSPAACAAGATCVSPATCASGKCVACVADGDCRAGRRCVEGECREPATCTADAQCGPRRGCVDGTCTEVECRTDSYEPNDTTTEAAAIPPGQLEAMLCANEVDAYVLDLPEGSGARVTVIPAEGAPTPGLELVVGTGVPSAALTGTVAQGRVSATLERAPAGSKSLLVRVTSSAGTSAGYRLVTQVEAGGLCANDAREPDGSLTLAAGATAGSYTGILCPREEDWFAIEVPEGNRPEATLVVRPEPPATGVPPDQSVELTIYATVNGQSLRDGYDFWHADPARPTFAPASRVAPAGGSRYWVSVHNAQPVKYRYELQLEVKPKPPANDACDHATLLAASGRVTGSTRPATDAGAASCGGAGGNDVFYALTLTEPSRVRLSLVSGFEAVLSLSSQVPTPTASRCEDVELACQAGGGSSQTLAYDALPAGKWIVRIDGSAGKSGDYSLTTDVRAADPAPAGETCDTAAPLVFTDGRATVTGSVALAANDLATACGTDAGDAVYALELTDPKHVRASITGFAGAAISLVRADACGASSGTCVAAQNRNGSYVADLERAALAAGSWRLVVEGGSAVAGEFTLDVNLSDPLPVPTNDACEGVAELAATQQGDTSGATNDLTPACAGRAPAAGDVVYRFFANGETQADLQLTAAFDGALSVTSACDTGTVLACQSGRSPRVRLPALPGGEYFVWVDGYTTGRGTFTLTSALAPADPAPGNDTCQGAEIVDFASGPQSVGGSTARALDDVHPNACVQTGSLTKLDLDGPDVAYAVTVPAGRTLRATLTPDGFDGALYVLDGCDTNTCVAGADLNTQSGEPETITATNAGATEVTWTVVVDSFRPGAFGAYSLALELAAP